MDDIYFGEFKPYANNYPSTPEMEKAFQVIDESEKKLGLLLDGDEKKLFLDFVNAHDEIVDTVNYQSFINGFKLGCKLFLDVTAS